MRMHLPRSVRVTALAAAILAAAPRAGALTPQPHLTPVVLFPAFHFTKLRVTVAHQAVAPECPRSGAFSDWFLNDTTSDFSQACQDKLLTLAYRSGPLPMRLRFSEQPGVRVDFIDYGKTSSAPFYEPLYAFLEANGYQRDVNIRVAGYDSRLSPDMGLFVERTRLLVEATYRENGMTPVHLVGHSNGPIYAQYFLTHVPREWKDKFIHGFTPIAGNLPGQGLSYLLFFTGLDITYFTFPADPESARASAAMYQSLPSSYVMAAAPAVFGDREVVLTSRASGRSYTPLDFDQLFADAGRPVAREIAAHYIGFLEFTDPAHYPDVDVFAEKGSGLPTAVGAEIDDLTTGQLLGESTVLLLRAGDANQEDLTNDAVQAWRGMRCFHFELNDNPGVDHFNLPSNEAVLARLLAHLRRPRSRCP